MITDKFKTVFNQINYKSGYLHISFTINKKFDFINNYL